MKKYFIIPCILICLVLTACNDKTANLTQTNTRAIHIAGMPAADRDFRLNAHVYAIPNGVQR